MLSTTDLASLPNRPPAQDTPDTPSTASIKLRSMPSPSKQPEIVAVQAPPRLSQRPTIHFRGSETDSSPPSVIYESRQSPVRGRDWKRITSFAVLCLANLLCAIDGSIVSVALPVIAAALQGSALQAFWAGTSFLLASALCQPLWAELAPLFGQKTLLLVALACFTTGTCLAVLATNFPFLLTARSMQGVGVGGILALTYTIVANLVSLRERGKWFGLIASQWALGSAIAPLLGGWLAQTADWRWIFLSTVPLCVLALLVTPFCLHLRQDPGATKAQRVALDWPGALAFTGSITTVLVPLTWSGIVYDWRSAQTVAPIAVGGVGLLSFAVYNRYVSKQPFIRPSLLSSATAKAAYFGALVHGVLVYSVLYYMPIYFQAVQGYTLLQSGASLLPYSLTTGFFAIGVGWAIAKTGTYRLYVGVGWAITTLGMGLLLYLRFETSVPVWILIHSVGGVGFGIVWSAGSFAAQAAAADSDLLFAAAFFAFVRSIGQTIGVALGGVLFQNTFQRNIERNPLYAPYARRWAQDASALIGAVNDLTAPQDQALKIFMVAAYVDSLRVVWAVLCGLSALALVVNAVWIRDMTLDRKAEHGPNPVRSASRPLPRHIPSHNSEDGFKAVKY